jgi:hypothetical protein
VTQNRSLAAGTTDAARRDAVSARYAVFYAPFALAVGALALVPLVRDQVTPDVAGTPVHYGSLLEMSDTNTAAGLAVIMIIALVALFTTAVFRARHPGLPFSIAVLAALLLLELLARPGSPYGRPPLTAAGTVGVLLAIWALVLGLAHALHLLLVSRTPVDPAPAPGSAVTPTVQQQPDAS